MIQFWRKSVNEVQLEGPGEEVSQFIDGLMKAGEANAPACLVDLLFPRKSSLLALLPPVGTVWSSGGEGAGEGGAG